MSTTKIFLDHPLHFSGHSLVLVACDASSLYGELLQTDKQYPIEDSPYRYKVCVIQDGQNS